MAQAGWFMYQRWNNVPVGVFATEDKAKQAASDGEYVLVPIEANQSYANMMDETLPGAIIYTASGFDTRLTTLENQIVVLDSEVDTIKNQAQTKFAQIDGRLDGHDISIADLDARVTALEVP